MGTGWADRVCLVAGGAGFIGGNLCRELLRRGAVVDCADNLSTGRLASIADLRQSNRFRFLEIDVACEKRLTRSYTDIFHLACPTGVPNIARLGDQMMLACSAGTFNLLNLARKSKARFLYASSAEVYGDPEVFPQTEDYSGSVDPRGPRSAYEEGKRFGEAAVRYYADHYGVDARIIRIFNTYGPGMSPLDQRVIPQMIAQMIAGQPVKIYGDGSQTRTFLYISDLIEGFLTALAHGGPGKVYNIGGRQQISILALFHVMQGLIRQPSSAVFEPHFIQDHSGRQPDTSRIEALGWRAQVPLEKGLMAAYRAAARDIMLQRRRTRAKQEVAFPLPVAASTIEVPPGHLSAR